MSTKKGRGAKVPRVPQDENKKGSSVDDGESPNLSVIERASFLEGLQLNYGNPLHSTAMEEDLSVLEEERANKGKAGRKDIPQTLKTAVKQRGGAKKRKETERDDENEEEEEEEEKKKKSRTTGGKVEARSDPTSNQPIPTANGLKKLVGKKPAKRRSAGQTSAARPVKNRQTKKGKKKESESGSGKSSDPQSQTSFSFYPPKEESDISTTQQRRKKVLSSDEEETDEDTSLNPSPKKAKVYSLSRTRKSSSDGSKSRKSSSGSASAGANKADTNRQRKKRRPQGGTELEVVLEAFLDFCEQYRESVESKAVKQSIDCFSSNVKEQLLEKITSYKELKVLKRDNAKVGSLIRGKTQRLLDAKQELMRAERQVWLLQKEKAELELRLGDLRRGQAFLHDIKELNKQYLGFRHKHPREKETYGASSLPALLLEAKHIQAAEHQLRGINNRLERRLGLGNNVLCHTHTQTHTD
ncbi:centromere protein U isoform X2 [Dicentrarchus labrax]|uniref:centromere protein U isoform X2 n=1 Tax=Dicentrarchus labrax TaxID=13489 RepID=UPI0021F52531|nr:centromere protein U isoform X2 [Dicentrarchus labrax]